MQNKTHYIALVINKVIALSDKFMKTFLTYNLNLKQRNYRTVHSYS